MRFTSKFVNSINLFTRLICLLLFLLITNSQSYGQGDCNNAIPIFNSPGQNIMWGNLDPNTTGVPGFVGCFNFLNKPTNFYRIYNLTPGTLMRLDLLYSSGDIQVAIYKGTCDNLRPFQCQILKPSQGNPLGAESSLFYEVQINGNFFVQVGYPDGRTEPYEIEVNYEAGTSNCSTRSSSIRANHSSMNSPIDGPYVPGEVVNFCAEIEWDANNSNCQWLHGVTPILGEGWDRDFYTTNGPPLTYSSSNQFSWYPDFWLNYNYDGRFFSQGDFVPAGWFVTGTPGNNTCANGNYQTNPQCSYGINQSCDGILHHTLCFDLKVRDDIDCNISTTSADLSVGVFTFGDGETGSWPQGGCDDDGAVIKNYGAACCEQISPNIPDVFTSACVDQQTTINLYEQLVNIPNAQDYSFVYRSQASSSYVDFYDCFENCGGEIELDSNLGFTVNGYMLFFVSVLDQELCTVASFEYRVEMYMPDAIVPVITPSLHNTRICENELPITLTGSDRNACNSDFSYFWTYPNGISSDQLAIDIDFPGTYTFHTINNQGVEKTASYTLRTKPSPDIVFDIPAQLCPSNDLQDILRANPAGGIWSMQGVQIDQFFGPDIGIYTVTYTVDGSNGCQAESTFDIEVVLDPNVTVEFPDYVCVSDQLQDVLNPIPPGGTFDPSPILEGDQIIATQSGTFPITYRYGDPGTICNGSFTFTINVEDSPSVILETTAAEICQNTNPIDILVAGPAGGIFLTNNVDSDGNFLPTDLGVNVVEYSYTNPATGCSGSAIIEILVVEGDLVTIDDPGSICSNSTNQLTADPIGGLWSGNDVTPDGIFTPLSSTIYPITYTYINADGCVSSQTEEIEVINGTAITVIHPEVVCNNAGPQTIVALPAGGVFDNYINAQNVFTPDVPGIYNMRYTYINNQGCENNYDFSIEVQEYLFPQISYPQDPVCLSQSTTYSLLADTPGGMFSGVAVTPSGEFSPTTAGINQLSYGPSPDNQCIASVNFDIEVVQDLVVTVSHPNILCRRPLPYDVLIPNIPGGTWSGAVTADGRFQAFNIGSNPVTYEVEDPVTGCFGAYSFDIEVVQTSELPTPQLISPSIDNYCIYEIVELCIDPVPGATGYRWDSNFGIIEYASPNHLCIRIAWNALVQDEICITPSGDCGSSLNPLCITIDVVDNSNCVIIATGTSEQEEQEYAIFPNPTSDNVEINSNQLINTVVLVNTLGEIIINQDKINSKQFLLQLDKATPGIYFVLINGERMERILLTR